VSLFGPDPVGLLGVVILTSIGVWGMPQMIHKFYTIKDSKAIKKGTVISTLFAAVIAGGSYFMGAFGRLYLPSGQKVIFDNIVPTMLSNISDLLLGIVIVLVLSASMSTLSALVMTSSSTLTLDFIKGIIFRDLSAKKQVAVIRVFIAVFILFSVLLALDTNPNNIITALMSWSWGALAGSFLGPFIYGLYWKGTTKGGVLAGFISGTGITLTGFIIFLTKNNALIFKGPLSIFNSPINIGAFSILISLVIVPLVSLITPKLGEEHVEHSFSCYESGETVQTPKLSLRQTAGLSSEKI
jgi:SSS family solute:Na+ symporter